jgi:hypothetical protein
MLARLTAYLHVTVDFQQRRKNELTAELGVRFLICFSCLPLQEREDVEVPEYDQTR